MPPVQQFVVQTGATCYRGFGGVLQAQRGYFSAVFGGWDAGAAEGRARKDGLARR